MSGHNKGTIIVECNPSLRTRFLKILPFTDGLQVNFEDDDECIRIDYELSKQDADNLLKVLNDQDKKEFRLISHVDELPQQSSNEYDVARDVSQILCYDEDHDDDLDNPRDMLAQGVGSIGKPLDGKNNLQASNSKNLKSKSSCFYPPNDPRSFAQEDQSRMQPIGGAGIGQTQGQGQGVTGQGGLQPQNKGMYYASSMPYRVEDFDQVFGDDEPAYPPTQQPGRGGIHGQGMMMNPNLPRGGNINLNPNLNKGIGMHMGQQGMNQMYNPGGPGQMYQPMAGRPGANPNQFKAGVPPQGMAGPAYPQKQSQPRGMQPQADQYYGMQGYEEPQQPPPKAPRMKGQQQQPLQQPVFQDYYGEEDQLQYGANDYPTQPPIPAVNPRQPQPAPRGGRGGFQQAPQPLAKGGQQPYGYMREDYPQDPRMGYQEMPPANSRNQMPRGGANPSIRPSMGAPMAQPRYPDDQYYEEEYQEEDPYAQPQSYGRQQPTGKVSLNQATKTMVRHRDIPHLGQEFKSPIIRVLT